MADILNFMYLCCPNLKKKQMETKKIVSFTIPEEFIGKWCIAGISYGKHATYDVFYSDMIFETEIQAELYFRLLKLNPTKHKIVKIRQRYPTWQKEMYICEMNEQVLEEMINSDKIKKRVISVLIAGLIITMLTIIALA